MRSTSAAVLALVLVAGAATAAAGGTTTTRPRAAGAIVYSGGLNCAQRNCGDAKYNQRIFVIDAVGSKPRPITTLAADSSSPAWSPDGRSIVFARRSARAGSGYQLHVMRANGGDVRRITRGDRVDTEADWAPDAKRIVFRSDSTSGRSFDLYVVGANGKGLRNLTRHPDDVLARDPAWSPDGKWIAFERHRQDRGGGVYVIRPDGSGLKRIVADGADPAWSADGTRIAFTRYTTGKGFAVYVANRAGQGQRAVVEGSSPAWSPDGKRLAFVTPFGQIAVVSTRGGRVKQLTKKGTAADHVDW